MGAWQNDAASNATYRQDILICKQRAMNAAGRTACRGFARRVARVLRNCGKTRWARGARRSHAGGMLLGGHCLASTGVLKTTRR